MVEADIGVMVQNGHNDKNFIIMTILGSFTRNTFIYGE